MEPIYLVCGFPRSGTSMMMRALEHGGMWVVFDPLMDRREEPDPRYKPCSHGYYELGDRTHRISFEGKAIKCLNGHMDAICPDVFNYQAVYMIRSPIEIAVSYARTAVKPSKRSFKDYEIEVDRDLKFLKASGIETTVLRYERVVAKPREQLGRLASAGWPFDVDRAASTIDPLLYRNRLCDLIRH